MYDCTSHWRTAFSFSGTWPGHLLTTSFFHAGNLCLPPPPRYLTLRARLLYWKEALVRYNRLFGSTMEQYIKKVMVPELIGKGYRFTNAAEAWRRPAPTAPT